MMIFTRDRKVRLGAAAVLAGMFAAGVAVGYVADRETPPAPTELSESEAQDRGSSPPSDRIVDRLDMTPEQRVRVDSVLTEYGQQMSDLQREYRPRFRQMVESANTALMELLTEEQRLRYDSLETAAERRRDGDGSPGRL